MKKLFTMALVEGDRALLDAALKIARAGNPTLSMAEVIRLALRAFVEGANQTVAYLPAVPVVGKIDAETGKIVIEEIKA